MKCSAGAVAIALVVAFFALTPATAATITIVNQDGPNEGFNDPTPASPEGGNPATTRGAQRLAVFQRAAQILGAQLQSSVEIRIGATFDSFNADPNLPQPACAAGGGILGFAGPTTVARDFPSAPLAGTWYPIALAEALSGTNRNGTNPEVDAAFNSDVDAACLGPGTRFWYGTTSTTPSGNQIALLPVVLHELSHGLGFLTLVCVEPSGCGTGSPQGSFAGGFPDVWTDFLANSGNPSLTWRSMSQAQRISSITGDPNTVWVGSNVSNAIASQGIVAGLSAGFLRMHAPSPVRGGSSISHFSRDASPNLLMEPAISSNLFAQLDMTIPLFRDIGWTAATSTNAAPTITAPASYSGSEDQSLVIGSTSFADSDAGSGSLTATFSVASGSLNATASSGVTIGGSGTARTLAGTLSSINGLLSANRLSYVPVANANGTVNLAITINDNGNTGGAPQSANRSVPMNIAAVNDPPAASAPATVALSEDQASAIAGINVADVDVGAGTMRLTFGVPAGSITATGNPLITVGGSATARTITGTPGNLNDFIATGGVSYTGGANANGNVTLTMTVNDLGNTGGGGAQETPREITLQIAAVNDPPTVAAPASLAVTAGQSVGVAGVVYSDPDAPGGGINVTATYAAGSGTFSASNAGGVTVAGSGTASLTLSGTLSAINSLVASVPVQYTASAAISGMVPLTLSINDQGNIGGGALSGSRVINTTVMAADVLFMNDFE
jgi:hypothetical protein